VAGSHGGKVEPELASDRVRMLLRFVGLSMAARLGGTGNSLNRQQTAMNL